MKMLPVALLVLLFTFSNAQRMKTSVEIPGDLTIALLVNTCHNATVDLIPYHTNSLVSSAMWIVERLNYLEHTAPLTLGLKVYEICEEIDYFKSIFDLYQSENDHLLTVVSEDRLSEKMLNFCEVLDIKSSSIARCSKLLVHTTVEFLDALGWVENVTVFGPDEFIMEEFSSYAVKQSVCVMDLVIYGSACPNLMNISTPIVYFGNKCNIEHFSTHQENYTNDMLKMIFVPLDGSVPADLPERSFVIIPPHFPTSLTYQIPENIIPTPLLFETANPMLEAVKSLQITFKNRCNDTNKLNILDCIKNTDIKRNPYRVLSLSAILEYLKVEPLKEHFVYDIYRVDNDSTVKNSFLRPFTKAFTYNLFSQNLTLIEQSLDAFVSNATFRSDPEECLNFLLNRDLKYITGDGRYLSFKSESWVYAFISLSLLGILFCISIFTFLLICICRRDVLEGNPILTLALLLATVLLLSSVLPFILKTTKYNSNALCLAKSMAITLSYALVFSLLLSRSILLASASKEIGFMSHIAGPVQSFLCLFIFGVQPALNLQIIGRCVDVFQDSSLLYLMSYNAMLLLLLLCLAPLMYKCQRNYREGKYFTIAVISISVIWCIWIPLYGYVDDDWRDLVLCFGIVGTSMVLLGTLFIPRTYLMTIAAARDRITSTLPSLATGTSTLDLYRANTQPIYDCVNVAAINAATVATVPTQTLQRPDLYSCPALPEDDDLDFRCDTPPPPDKMTRF